MIGEMLKKLRTEAKLSQGELGFRLGVSQQAVGQWEKGTREPDAEMIKKISKIFNVTTDYLMGNSTENSNNLREVMIIRKDITLQFIQKLMRDTEIGKVKWKRLNSDTIDTRLINPTLSFFTNVVGGKVYLVYKNSNTVAMSIQFSAKDENTAIDIPFDPETQAKINDLYNEVYSTLPNIEEFFNQYLSSDN